MIFNLGLQDIENGIKGENKGLDLGLPRLMDYIPGLQAGNSYLIGGESGSGKSMFAMNNFVYSPYDDYIKNYKDSFNLKIFIWSAEMSKSALGIRAISRKLYLDYGIVADTNYILSRGKNRVSQEIFNKIKSLSDYFEEMTNHIEVFANENPVGARATILKYINDNGKTFHKKVNTTDGEIEVFDYYKPYKKQLVIGVFDHIGIIKSLKGMNKKETIDKLMAYQIDMRDMFGVSFVNVQQLNRSLSSSDRFKLGMVTPQLSDFKESSDSIDAANYVTSIFSPQRYEISPFRDYIINAKDGGLADRFRAISILKNREGASDKILGTMFLGECGIIKELPRVSDMTRDIYDKINKIKKVE